MQLNNVQSKSYVPPRENTEDDRMFAPFLYTWKFFTSNETPTVEKVSMAAVTIPLLPVALVGLVGFSLLNGALDLENMANVDQENMPADKEKID